MAKAPNERESGVHPGGEKVHGDKLRAAASQEGGAAAPLNPKIQGEGDYEAARRYRKDVEGYVEEEGPDGIAKKAKAAEKALDGPEASELRIAEKKGEERARR